MIFKILPFVVLPYLGTNPDDICPLSQTPSLMTFGPIRLTLSTAKNLGVLKQDGVPLDTCGKKGDQQSISRCRGNN